MRRPLNKQLPARVKSRPNFGEYEDVDSRFDLNYTTSIEIFSLQNRAAKSEERLNMVDSKIDSLISEIRTLRWWVLGVVIGGVITTIGAMICFAQLQGTWFQDAINARKESTDRQIEDMKSSWQAINAEQQKRFEILLDRIEERTNRLEQSKK